MGRRCGKGKPCGLTCIERIKECLKEHPEKVSQALGMARNYIERAKENPAKEVGIQEKLRAQGIRAFYEKLSQDRGDGQGTHLENPNEQSFKILAALHKFSEERDARLNRLEGKEKLPFIGKDGKVVMVEPKRWYPDTLNLDKMAEKFKDNPSEARKKYEDRLIESLLAKGVKSDDPQAILTMGGPGSGKTTLLNSINKNGFVLIDADDIKSKLPEFLIGLGAGDKEIGNKVQWTSIRLVIDLMEKAQARGLNLIMDGTGGNFDVYKKTVEDLKGKGYRINIMAQHAPAEEGIKRAVARAELPLSMGGGRYVPEHFITWSYQNIPGNFLRLAKMVDEASLTDSRGDKTMAKYRDGKITEVDPKPMKEYAKYAREQKIARDKRKAAEAQQKT
jgi:predicted ABC-type ATPase